MSKQNEKDSDRERNDEIHEILHGAKLSEKELFMSKDGSSVTATPIMIDFRRLLQTGTSSDPFAGASFLENVVSGVSNRELLHAVVGLYDTSLSEMTPDVIYAAVCDRRARTILLLQEFEETVQGVERRLKRSTSNTEEEEPFPGEIDPEEDLYDAGEAEPATFAAAYSDTEEEEEEESDEDDEEDFSVGCKSFLKRAFKRRKKRKEHKGVVPQDSIGIESRLVGCATYEKLYCKGSERVVHLTFITVRPRFRKHNIGKYLLSKVKDPDVVGSYDAVVVHADNSAVDFFKRYGFSDDLVLNSKWSELAEQYTNCTLMSYLPPFTGQTLTKNSLPELDLLAMERDIKKWRDRSLEAYQSELSLMMRMRHEIIHLRALVSSQQDLIASLLTRNDELQQDKVWLEKKLIEYRLLATSTLTNGHLSDSENGDTEAELGEELAALSKQLEEQLTQKITDLTGGEKPADESYQKQSPRSGNSAYEHGEDLMDFYQISEQCEKAARKDVTFTKTFSVRKVTKADLIDGGNDTPRRRQVAAHSNPTTDSKLLYFCGTRDKPETVRRIFRTGFTETDLIHGDYGKGLYFSSYPTKALHFSVTGKLLVAKVALGKSQHVPDKEPFRSNPDEGYDSLLTKGRLLDAAVGDGDAQLYEEYVVFDPSKAKPAYIIDYTMGTEQARQAAKT